MQDCASPSSETVTVTRSHQGTVEVRVEGDCAVAEEARARAVIARNTGHSIMCPAPRARLPSPSATARTVATCSPQRATPYSCPWLMAGFLGPAHRLAVWA